MKTTKTKLEGCFIYQPDVFNDSRGYFFESYNRNTLKEILPQQTRFIQDNESFSCRGVLRGLHYQIGDFAQAKLVRVVLGEVLDIAVDLRKDSDTYLQYISVELTGDNKKQLFVPRGFAHGFVVLSETATLAYKCDNYYSKIHERGIIYSDTTLNIDWKLPTSSLIISEKDQNLPTLENAEI